MRVPVRRVQQHQRTHQPQLGQHIAHDLSSPKQTTRQLRRTGTRTARGRRRRHQPFRATSEEHEGMEARDSEPPGHRRARPPRPRGLRPLHAARARPPPGRCSRRRAGDDGWSPRPADPDRVAPLQPSRPRGLRRSAPEPPQCCRRRRRARIHTLRAAAGSAAALRHRYLEAASRSPSASRPDRSDGTVSPHSRRPEWTRATTCEALVASHSAVDRPAPGRLVS
jgi:hypothetical protein